MINFTSVFKAGQQVRQIAGDANNARVAFHDVRTADKGQIGRDVGRVAFNQATGKGKEAGKTWLKTFEVIPRFVLRALQFVMALAAVGFYGNRVDADRKAGKSMAPEWLYAVVICGSSALTAILFLLAASAGAIPIIGSRLKMFKVYRAYAWDATLFVAWLVAFGIFAGIFLKRKSDDPYKGASVRVMKVAVWIDLVNAVLWLASAVCGVLKTYLGRKSDDLSNKVGDKMFSKKNKNKGDDKGDEMTNFSSV